MIYVRIPHDRIAVVIGPHGETKAAIEKRGGIRIDVDTDDNEVVIHEEEDGADPLMALKVHDIVKAIGRGFSPEHAQRLWSDDVYFELLDIHEYVGKGKNHVRRVKGRVIGAEGKTRRIIEDQTGCDLAIYGHSVAIIGDMENLANAKQAVDMILRGSEHANVYRFLETKKREQRKQAMW